jgi:uncharacterized membrane protein
MTDRAQKTQITGWERIYPYILIIGAAIGILAAGVLMVDKIKLAQDAGFNPNCNLNPIFSCTSVMKSEEANAFGFPNPIIGLVSFGIVITVGMALRAKATFKRWFWLGLQGGTLFGVLFIHWLFYHTVYDIQALCIYCMVVWTVTIPMFWYTLLYNLRHGYIVTPKPLKKLVAFAQTNHLGILIVWYLTIAVLILHHFWYYFGPK